jgi:putative transposase
MNRTWGNIELFEDAGDYEAFERVLAQAVKREPSMRICAYCLMPNHFHLVLWPQRDGLLSTFMQWLTMTHALRWHAHRHSVGRGHLYQGRFKSFAIQKDGHFLSVCRYVERNALRASLTDRAEHWRWCSIYARSNTAAAMNASLASWPVSRPQDWTARINQPQDEAELAALRSSNDRGRPYGGARWAFRTARRLRVESSIRSIGRPKKTL